MCQKCLREWNNQENFQFFSGRIIPLYHEGFTALEISRITRIPLDIVETAIEEHA